MSRHREAFEEIAEKAESRLGDSLKQLYLYGSVARGEETEESDVDVFAVVESKEDKNWLEDMAAKAGVEHGVLVSIIVKTEESFDEIKDSSFVEEVRKGVAYV